MKSSQNTTYDTNSTLTGRCTSKYEREIYGLPQAGMLANKLLKHRLAKHGYYEVRHTPGYWRHTWCPIDFTLVVDGFGVGYKNNEHALHLLQTLRQYYEAVSINWTGTQTMKEKAEHFLMYAATHPNSTINYYKSDMILKIHSDASYLSE